LDASAVTLVDYEKDFASPHGFDNFKEGKTAISPDFISQKVADQLCCGPVKRIRKRSELDIDCGEDAS